MANENERDQNEVSGQQPPLGQDTDNQGAGQAGVQQGQQGGSQGQQGGDFQGGQSSGGGASPGEFGQQGGQSATGEASQGDTGTMSRDDTPGGGAGSTGESGGFGGGAGTGGGEGSDPTAGLQGTGGREGEGFIGQQGTGSDDYLQQGGNPESGFAEQGRGASEEDDVEGSSNS